MGGGSGVSVERAYPVLRGAHAAVGPAEAEHPRASLPARRALQPPVARHAQVVLDAPEHAAVQTHAAAETAVARLRRCS